MEHHLEGMLDRDQRTAKLRLYENYHRAQSNNKPFAENASIETNQNRPVSHCAAAAVPRRAGPHYTRYTNKKGHRTSIQRLGRILIVGVCLTVLALPKATLAAPKELVNMAARPMRWQNPCGDEHQTSSDPNPGPINECELLRVIVNQAETSLNAAMQFKKEFLDTNFKITNSEEVFKDETYDWLPALPKKFGGNVTEDYLKTREIKRSLLDTSEYLQRLAVGIEQVVTSQNTLHGHFYRHFQDTEHKLLLVLCELHTAIRAYQLQSEIPAIGRDIMDALLIDTEDSTLLKVRDWVIYREYMNCLEYIIEVFGYLRSNL